MTINGRMRDDGLGGSVRAQRHGLSCRLLVGASALALLAGNGAAQAEIGPLTSVGPERLAPRMSSQSPNLPAAPGARAFDIPPGDLQGALLEFSRVADLQLLYPSAMTAGLATAGVQGSFTPEEALRRLLAGSGLNYRFSDSGTITLAEAGVQPAPEVGEGALRLGPIAVQGRAGDGVEGFRAERSSTATRIDAPLLETPAQVNVVTGDFLDSIRARRPEDAFVYVPGVSQSGAQENSGTTVNFNIRGFNNNRQFFVNGLRGNERFGAGIPDLATVERIDILKGTSSLLFGTAKPGGLINIITKRPQPEFQHSIETQLGTFDALDLARIELDSTGPVTKDGNLLYRMIVAGSHQRSTRRGDNSDPNAFIDNVTVAPSLTWFTPTGGQLDIDFEYRFNDQPLDTGIFFFDDRFLFNNDSLVGPGSKNESDNFKFEVRYTQPLTENWELRLSANYFDTQRDQFMNTFPLGARGDALLDQGIFVVKDDYQQTQPRVELAGTWQPLEWMEHKLLFGADYFYTSTKTRSGFDSVPDAIDPLNPQVSPAPGPIALGPESDFPTEEYGFYFQDHIRLFDRLTLLGGVRVLSFKQKFDGEVFAEDDNIVDFTVGASYSVTDNIAPFVSFSTSTEIQFGELASGGFVPPRESEQIEAGIKTEWFDGRFGVNLSVFEIEQTNKAEGDPSDPTGLTSILVGTERSRGVELEVVGNPWRGLSLSGGFSYIDAEITESTTPANIGLRPVSVPEVQASLYAQYDFTNEFGGALDGFYLGSGLVYVDDERPGDSANTFTLPSFTRWDLAGGYRKDGWDVALNIENVTNKNYVAGSRDFFRVVQGPKRFVTLTARREF